VKEEKSLSGQGDIVGPISIDVIPVVNIPPRTSTSWLWVWIDM